MAIPQITFSTSDLATADSTERVLRQFQDQIQQVVQVQRQPAPQLDLNALARQLAPLLQPLMQNSTTGDTNAGTYVPSVVLVSNVAAVAPVAGESLFAWLRVGATVTVAGRLNIQATAAGAVLTEINLTLPYLAGTIDAMAGSGVSVFAGTAGIDTFIVRFGSGVARVIADNVVTTAMGNFAIHFTYHLS